MKHPRIKTGYIKYIEGEYHSFLYLMGICDGVERTDAVEVNWTANRWVWW